MGLLLSSAGPRGPRFIAFIPLLALLSVTAAADVVTIGAAKDNTLYEDASGDLSNGAGRYMFVGRTNQGSGADHRRALIEFDLTAAIPPGSVVQSVSLELYMSKTISGPQTVGLHYVLEEWGEGASDASGQEGGGDAVEAGDATWLHTFYPGQLWTQAGGDYVGTASATASVVGETFYTWADSQMIGDVQTWVDDPTTNHGWLLRGNESSGGTTKRFDTRENNTVSQRPMLTVTFVPGSSGGACCLPDGTCLEISQGDCTTLGGVYQGDGTDCTPNLCPQPTGACCFDDGSCLEISAADCALMSGTYQGDGSACTPALCPVVLEPFVDPLPLPAVAQPISGQPGGRATYDIAMQEFQQQLHRDLPPTTLWGYAGLYPGPTIEASVGLPVTVHWRNDLRDSAGVLRTEHLLPVDTCPHGPDHEGNNPRTVVHLHGGHVPQQFDGYPEDTFLPGEMDTYVYPNDQPPATLWYHDHALGITRLNVYLGLAAFYLLRDQDELDLGLPAGEYELPLAIQDRSFKQDGSLRYPAAWQDHFFGDTILVNGKVWPYHEVKQGKYRLRLLSGSNSRAYRLRLSPPQPFVQIGTDGGLLPAPVLVDELTLAGGERADVIVDFAQYAPGTEVLLLNDAPAPFPGTPGVGVVPNVMKFIVTAASGHTDRVPASLTPVPPIDPATAIQERTFLLRKQPEDCAGSYWLINDLVWDDITEFPEIGTTEIWDFANASNVLHPMHMHLVLYQVLDRQDFMLGPNDEVIPIGSPVPPAPEEQGWKDTVKVMPQQITRVIARFEDYFGKFSYHCHVLEHEDHEMMRQFQVVAGSGVQYCFGVGCPCGNDDPDAGCANGDLGVGSELFGTGTAAVGADSLVLNAILSTPGQPGIFFQGEDALNEGAGFPFGDGLRCTGTNVVRLEVVYADSMGSVQSSIAIATKGGASAGDVRRYQWWYRDPGTSPCDSLFNLSNGLEVTWAP